MIAFLTSRLGIGVIGIVGVVLMYLGWTFQVSNIRAEHATEIAAEQKRSADTQRAFDDYKLQVSQQIANQERIRADENLTALNEREAMAAEIDRLRVVNATATRQRNEVSQELTKVLNNAKATDINQLGPAVRTYLDGVRKRQRVAR